MAYIFKTIIFLSVLGAVIAVIMFALQKGNTTRSEFKDGSYFVIHQPENWCLDNNSVWGWLQMQASGLKSVKMLEPGTCGLIMPTTSDNASIIAFAAMERAAEEVELCKSRQKYEAPFQAIGGKVLYCEIENKKDHSKKLVNFLFPVDAHKSLTVFMDKWFFIKNSKDIIRTLEALKYIPAEKTK